MKSREKWFNNKKGFGFLNYDIGNDVFIHCSQVLVDEYKNLSENEVIQFDTTERQKRFQIENVKSVKENIYN